MKVLVTGATGFVGSWMVKKLLVEGLDVRILRRKSSKQTAFPTGVEETIGDVTDLQSLIMATRDVHSVFHLAGHVGYSRADREIMESINVKGTENILQACTQNGVTRLVHMSSVVAVGASFDGLKPLNESSEYNIHHLNLGYFETKWAAENAVKRAVAEGKVDAVIVNPSTIYGAGDAEKGSRKIQVKVALGKFPFYTSGGASIIAIEDIVDATFAAWKRGRTGERYILSGENITIQEIFRLIAEAAGCEPPKFRIPDPVVHLIGKAGDQLEKFGRKGPLNSESAWTSLLFHWFDNQKAKEELGLKPRSARSAIGESVGWMKERGIIP